MKILLFLSLLMSIIMSKPPVIRTKDKLSKNTEIDKVRTYQKYFV